MEKSGGSQFFNSLSLILQTHWPSKGEICAFNSFCGDRQLQLN